MSSLKYRDDIDGLRAISVLIVIFYHAYIPGFSGGYVGVDVFFVISGYLISKILLAEITQTNTISFANFFARRIRRLFPALIFVIIVTIIFWAIFFTGLSFDTIKFIKSIPYSIAGLANMYFMKKTGGYFNGANDEMPLIHFWSLAVEEQFYLLYPLIIFGLSRISSNIQKSFKYFLILIFFITVIASQWMVKNNMQTEAFYLMPPRAWEFSIGALLLFIPKKFYDALGKNPKYFDIFGMIGLGGIFYSAAMFHEKKNFPGINALYPTLGACLLLIASEADHRQGKIYQFLSSKALVFIGTISYGLYLWHQPILAFAKILNFGKTPAIHIQFSLILLSALLAWLSFQYIEKPLRYDQKSKKSSFRRTFALSTITGFLVFFLSKGLGYYESWSIYSKNMVSFYQELNKRSSFYPKCVDQQERWDLTKCSTVSDFSKTKEHVILWGDSQSFALFPMLERYGELNPQLSASLFSNNGVAPLLDYQSYYEVGKKHFLGVIANNKKSFPDQKVTVILMSHWLKYIDLHGSLLPLETKLTNTVAALKASGVDKVVIVAPYPQFSRDVLRCVVLKGKEDCYVTRRDFENHRSDTLKVLQKVSSTDQSFMRVLDPAEYLCDKEKCPELHNVDGHLKPIVFDNNHPSFYAARLLGEKTIKIITD